MFIHSENFYNKKIKQTIDIINNDKSTIYNIMNHIISYTNLNNFFIKINKNRIIINNFLLKNKINSELFFIIIDEIDKLKGKYNSIYCNEYKLFMILQLEDDINKWSSLQKLLFYSPENTKVRHYETIRSQYQRWCSKNIFKNAFNKVIPLGSTDFVNNTTNIELDNEIYLIDVLKDYFIDSTNINNLRGSENLIINPELKKKKITKITEICDVDGFVVSITFNEPLKKIINYNCQNIDIKTSKNDSNCIKETLNNKNININLDNIVLIGDKGYKIKENNDINLEIITPNKKNQKNKLINRHQNKKLKYRHIVENSINGWKHKERINLRKDKKIINFAGWVYISVLNHNLNVNKIKKEIYK